MFGKHFSLLTQSGEQNNTNFAPPKCEANNNYAMWSQ